MTQLGADVRAAGPAARLTPPAAVRAHAGRAAPAAPAHVLSPRARGSPLSQERCPPATSAPPSQRRCLLRAHAHTARNLHAQSAEGERKEGKGEESEKLRTHPSRMQTLPSPPIALALALPACSSTCAPRSARSGCCAGWPAGWAPSRSAPRAPRARPVPAGADRRPAHAPPDSPPGSRPTRLTIKTSLSLHVTWRKQVWDQSAYNQELHWPAAKCERGTRRRFWGSPSMLCTPARCARPTPAPHPPFLPKA